MKEITRITNTYLYIKGEKKCYLHMIKCDRNATSSPNFTSKCWISGWNPLPICGEFNTSLSVFDEWMIKMGWNRYVMPITTVIEKEEVTNQTRRARI